MKIKVGGFNSAIDDEPAVTKFIQADTNDELLDKLSNFARGYAAVNVEVLAK
jgi:hypothetical protein